jgi:DivIVA domain-containing protein
VDLDRQSIERRDFPISRRGYDPAAVDAYLRALAAEVQELRERPTPGRASESLGSAAASQVQGILEAAETTAADIERHATEDAARMREEATQDAQRTRAEAVKRAQEHVAAVTQATAVLQGRVESMDGEVAGLVQSLQAGAGRLAVDLASVETNMGELYDAASGRGPATPTQERAEAVPVVRVAPAEPARPLAAPPPSISPVPGAGPVVGAPAAPKSPPPAERPAPPATPAAGAVQVSSGGDLDGARLVALNMALNGESREQAGRYLSENFQLADRERLLDEVYAAIEV